MATAKKTSGKRAGTTTGGKTLTVKLARNASIIELAFKLQQAYKQRGCPGCRSGIDQIVFQDPVLRSVK